MRPNPRAPERRHLHVQEGRERVRARARSTATGARAPSASPQSPAELPLARSPARPFARSPARPLAGLPARPPTRSPAYPLTRSPSRLLVCSSCRALACLQLARLRLHVPLACSLGARALACLPTGTPPTGLPTCLPAGLGPSACWPTRAPAPAGARSPACPACHEVRVDAPSPPPARPAWQPPRRHPTGSALRDRAPMSVAQTAPIPTCFTWNAAHVRVASRRPACPADLPQRTPAPVPRETAACHGIHRCGPPLRISWRDRPPRRTGETWRAGEPCA
jgi:hypothetical protein